MVSVRETREHWKAVLREFDSAKNAAFAIVEADDSPVRRGVAGFKRPFNDARIMLTTTLPHEVCPYCRGEGCTGCDNLGWVGKAKFDAASKDAQEAVKGWLDGNR